MDAASPLGHLAGREVSRPSVSSFPTSLFPGSMFSCSKGPARFGMIPREVPTVRHFMPAYL